jgi:hypothetical protein
MATESMAEQSTQTPWPDPERLDPFRPQDFVKLPASKTQSDRPESTEIPAPPARAIEGGRKRGATVGAGNQMTEAVPSVWLLAVLKLLYAMAEEGIEMEGCADPGLLLMEIASHVGVDDADDPWAAAIRKMRL